MRVYRVSRVASVRPLEEPFERPSGFELGAYWEEWSQAFERDRPRVEVTVRASEEMRRHLPRDRRIAPDGSVVVGFESLAEAYRAVLRFGPDLEVLEPAALRERVAATAREVAALYVPR